MQMSKRALRMERHHKRSKRGASLHLVSMMDIFTILVFFLLVNSGDTEALRAPKDVQLPESVAMEKTHETVVVTVTNDQILVQGKPVATVAAALEGDDIVIAPLLAALRGQSGATAGPQGSDDIAAREVTILGDKALPYRLLKRVMATCTTAEFGQISLAVEQKPEAGEAARVAAL